MLVILFLLFYFQAFILANKGEKKDGYCVIHFTELAEFDEVYTHTYVQSEPQRCLGRNWRYYTCWRDVQKQENRTRKVTKEVPKTKVECCSGYKNVTVHESVHHCVPICDPPCVQGHCVSPGNCTCFQGYEHISSNECAPVCEPKCINGICSTPGGCTCNSGYDKVNSSYCTPHCTQGCINGKCHKPEECSCYDGYIKNSNNMYICDPYCEERCISSTCIGPNICKCFTGFTKSKNIDNICNPFCELECLHGECIGPNECSCHEGYSMKDDSVNICEPVCKNCTNGICNAPNNCSCFENYTLTEDGYCEPHCDYCSNGKCVGPSICECFEGFQYNEDGICVPFCSSCDNGNCTKPEVCECFEGYENTSGTCFPVCKNGCAGGECVAPNNCSCEYDRVEENFCFPLEPEKYSFNWSEKLEARQFEIKLSDSYIDASALYIKVKCSFITNPKSNFTDLDQFSISCSSIKSLNTFKFLCIWNQFNNETISYYEDVLNTIIYNEAENLSLLRDELLKMTILLPTSILADEENCFVCPKNRRERFLSRSDLNISFSSCDFKKLHLASTAHWKGLTILTLGSFMTIVIITLSFLIWYYIKRSGRDYTVNSPTSHEMDETEFPLTPQEE